MIKGSKHTEESNQKNRMSNLGRHHSIKTEFKKGISYSPATQFKKGQVSLNKGKSPSEETRKKIGDAFRGKKLTEEHKNKIARGGLGRITSEETKRKLRESKLGDRNPMYGQGGDKNPNYKGGITPVSHKIRSSPKSRDWIRRCLVRDNFASQKTGIRGGELHVHHILNFSEYPKCRFDIDNGITLTKKEHKEFHKKYGRKNNTREQLEEFLKN